MDAVLLEQTIQTPCGCRCLLVTKYHAATFSTEEIVTCLHCADLDTVIAKITRTSQQMRYKSRARLAAVLGSGVASAGAFLATLGLSAVLTGALGVTSTVYLVGRQAHLAVMRFKIRRFKEKVRDKPRLKTCRCVGLGLLTDKVGKCALSFRDKPDSRLGN